MKSYKKQSGFTIVELLIVIVVIGILAAITIVAYNGIQNRSKGTSAKSLARQIVKKAEAYNSVQSSYPATLADFGTVKESTFDNASQVTDTTTLPSDEKKVAYKKCATGAAVYYYDAVSSKVQALGMGGQASVTDGVTAATACS